jgi:hypothetical protein
MLAKQVLDQYIYEILPYSVNLKQEGGKARSALLLRWQESKRLTLVPAHLPQETGRCPTRYEPSPCSPWSTQATLSTAVQRREP